MEFIKLKDILTVPYRVININGYKFKRWNEAEKKMETSDTPQKGFRKIYQVEIKTKDSGGVVDFSKSQLAEMLELSLQGNQADIKNKIFVCRSNGKTGMEIRYFFNLIDSTTNPQPEKPINTKNITF
jgi:hypothetical protein